MSVGMKTYVRELVARLPAVAPDLTFVAITNSDLTTDAATVRIAEDRAANASWGEQWTLPRVIARHAGARDSSIAHFMSVYAPRRSPIPYVYTIHDLIHKRYPRYFSWKIPLFYRFVVRHVAARAAFVLTDARATLPDLQCFLGVPAPRVRVVPLGVSQAYALDDAERLRCAAIARRTHRLDRPYVMYAGNHRRHKNLETLFKAWLALRQPCDLVLTEEGALPFDVSAYRSDWGNVRFVGHVTERKLIELYAGASAVVQPSLFEGFGLTVVEAMACGSPVVVARTSALTEVAGDAALSFDPLQSDELTQSMRALLSDSAFAEGLRRAGRLRAEAFTWDATATQTAASYREALEFAWGRT